MEWWSASSPTLFAADHGERAGALQAGEAGTPPASSDMNAASA